MATTPVARIARLSSAFLTSNLIRGALGFGLSLALGRGLGVERFGRWVLCTTWASTLTVVVDLGFGVLLARDGARKDAAHGSLLGSALAVRLTSALPFAVALYAAAPALAVDPETIAGLRLAAIVGIAGAIYGCFGAAFRSQPRWVPAILVIETAWTAAQLVGAWLLVSAGAGITALLLLMTAVQAAQIFSAMALWRIAFPGEAVRLPTRSELKGLLRRALPFAATGIVANLQARIGPLMLGYLSTPVEVGAFAAAARFGAVARLAPGAIFAGALPVLSHEYSSDPPSGIRTQTAFERTLTVFAIAMAIPFIVFASPLVRLAYGSSFAASSTVLVWVALGLVPALTNSARKIALYAVGEEAAALRWSTAALALQIAGCAALIPMVGAVGAAASLAIGEAVIWIPLWRIARSRRSARTDAPSSPRRALSPTPEHWPQSATAVSDR
jgi:O-antigen/teichoic acid export membrane protein